MDKRRSLENGLVLFVWCLFLFFSGLCVVELCYGEEGEEWEITLDGEQERGLRVDGIYERRRDRAERMIIYQDKSRTKVKEYMIQDLGGGTIVVEEAR